MLGNFGVLKSTGTFSANEKKKKLKIWGRCGKALEFSVEMEKKYMIGNFWGVGKH